MKIGILGSGTVGQTLAAGLMKHGHRVMICTREPAKLADWLQAHPGAKVSDSGEASAFGEILVLAVKGTAAQQALEAAGRRNLAGKTVIDACNPIADGPPDHGILPFFTGPNESLMEQLQRTFPEAHLVKAFNSVGSANMVNPPFPERPTMFICGNDGTAKNQVTAILDQFGWDTADMAQRKRHAPSSRCACCGAPSASQKTNGHTPFGCSTANGRRAQPTSKVI